MREIKFRFYDKTEKKMRYFNDIWNMPQPDYDFDEIQQYTGLKDKSGKEIYEGDIVEYKTYRFGKNGKDEKKTQLGEICWIENGFEVTWINPIDYVASGYQFVESLCREIKVVGNIYENKDLLTTLIK